MRLFVLKQLMGDTFTVDVVHNVLRKVEIKVISQGTRVQYTEWGTRGCVALTTKLVKIVKKNVFFYFIDKNSYEG